jgi:hypothetical protein
MLGRVCMLGRLLPEIHRHRSREFILLLKALDAHYPPRCLIRLVLDPLISPKKLWLGWPPSQIGLSMSTPSSTVPGSIDRDAVR